MTETQIDIQAQNNIGKFLIAGELGIGEIVEITEMGTNGDFYRVAFEKSAATNFFSVKNQSNYRFLETKKNLEKAIGIFNEKHSPMEFSSAQEKVQFFKKELKTTNVLNLAKYLSSLNQAKDIHPSINKVFKSSLNSFVEEIEFVFEIKNIEAWRLLGLNKNNK